MATEVCPAGLLFRAQREILSLSQTELGERLGVHYTTVARWETDAEGPPRVAVLAMCWLLYRSPLKASVARAYATRTNALAPA